MSLSYLSDNSIYVAGCIVDGIYSKRSFSEYEFPNNSGNKELLLLKKKKKLLLSPFEGRLVF